MNTLFIYFVANRGIEQDDMLLRPRDPNHCEVQVILKAHKNVGQTLLQCARPCTQLCGVRGNKLVILVK